MTATFPTTSLMSIVARDEIVNDCPISDIATAPVLCKCHYFVPKTDVLSMIKAGKTPANTKKLSATHTQYRYTLTETM